MTGMIETCQFCGQLIRGKARTNGDMIRSMTDEELAVTLTCPNEMGLADIECDRSDDCNCCQCLLDWLRGEEATKDERGRDEGGEADA